MKERPIIFQPDMARAILDDRKSQTRRTYGLKKINEIPDAHTKAIMLNDGTWTFWHPGNVCESWVRNVAYPNGGGFKCPYGKPSDRLYVRETFAKTININNYKNWPGRPHIRLDDDPKYALIYRADGEWPWEDDDGMSTERSYWKPSIHMPKWASRLTLEIVKVRVEKVQDITYAQVIAEGLTWLLTDEQQTDGSHRLGGIKAFGKLWDSINGKKYPWASNPWVWVIEFKGIKQ